MIKTNEISEDEALFILQPVFYLWLGFGVLFLVSLLFQQFCLLAQRC
jgi:hypothetical protein